MLYKENACMMMQRMMNGMWMMPCFCMQKKKCFSAVWHDPDWMMR